LKSLATLVGLRASHSLLDARTIHPITSAASTTDLAGVGSRRPFGEVCLKPVPTTGRACSFSAAIPEATLANPLPRQPLANWASSLFPEAEDPQAQSSLRTLPREETPNQPGPCIGRGGGRRGPAPTQLPSLYFRSPSSVAPEQAFLLPRDLLSQRKTRTGACISKQMECVVQGIIETQHVEALEVLLQGLCGVPKERFRIHEFCLKSGPNLGAVASEVRLMCDLEQPTPTWTVRHVGGAMRGSGAEQLSVLVRTMVESKASKNVLRFFYMLGYKLDHELLKVGFAFHIQRGARITITVTSINKMPKLHSIDEAVPVTPGIQLVEVTSPAAADNYNEVAAAISSFCEFLAPLVHLSKPGVSTGIVPTAAAAAASLMSNSGNKKL
ncbi:hypothetical protein Taro_001640, partial [Colocasia esculenta]|nr:hypothetical protein [Colocasia esculenta]